MHFSYDPPEQSLAEIMSDALDEVEGTVPDPAGQAAAFLHSRLLLHGKRHHIHADGDQVVLRLPPIAAHWLAQLLQDGWKSRRP